MTTPHPDAKPDGGPVDSRDEQQQVRAALLGDPHDAPPPAVRTDHARRITIIASGVIFAALLLVVVFNIEGPPSPVEGPVAADNLIELIPPAPLTEQERSADGTDITRDLQMELAHGGWIDIQDGERLAQRFRCRRHDPDPAGYGPGWMEMQQPELEIYLGDNQVVTLKGDVATAYAPHRALESGTVSGSVVIRMYEFPDNSSHLLADAEPVAEMRTDEAAFDNLLGEVRCDGDVHIETRTMELPGRGLRLLINDVDDSVTMRIQTYDFIRLASATPDDENESVPGAAAEPPVTSSAGLSAGQRDDVRAAPAPTRTASAQPPAPKPDEPEPLESISYYKLTLPKDVRIEQGTEGTARAATGSRLEMIFSPQSKGLGNLAATAPHSPRATPAPREVVRMPLPLRLSAMPFAAAQEVSIGLAPAPGPADTIITGSDGLTITPVTDPAEFPQSPEDAVLTLYGTPVRLDDDADGASVRCSEMSFHTLDQRIGLLGSVDHPLEIDTPDFIARGENFWLAQSTGLGGFDGQGYADLRDADADPGATPSSSPRTRRTDVHLSWTEGVDLVFDLDGDESALGQLRSATLRGNARLVSSSSTLDSISAVTTDMPPGREHLAADSITLTMRTGADGEAVPDTLAAQGNVEVSDEDQTLWTNALHATFREATTEHPASQPELDQVSATDGVHILLADGQHVFGDELHVDGHARTALLIREPHIQIADGRHLIDGGPRLVLNEQDGRYDLTGAGRLRQFSTPVITEAHAGAAMIDIEGLHLIEEAQITWRDGVELAAAPAWPDDPSATNDLQSAVFTGAVTVISADFELENADRVVVHFGGEGGPDVRAIDASGNIVARALSDPGTIRSDHIHVNLVANDAGETAVQQMIATGAVEVSDEEQWIWTEHLTVDLDPNGRPADPASSASDASASVGSVRSILAEEGVQLLLADGTRAYADKLLADPKAGTANLEGERVLVISDGFVLDHARHLALDRTENRFEALGAGTVNVYDEPLPVASAGLAPRPTIEQTPSVTASWTDGARYAEATDTARESLDLHGSVVVELESDPLERNTLSSDVLRLEFTEAQSDIIRTASPFGSDRGGRLARLIARGDARLENRVWLNEDRTDTPRVFYIAGDQVVHDVLTEETHVVGDGRLLIRDESPGDEPNAGAPVPFSGKGRTLFRWTERLHMAPVVDGRYRVMISGDVEAMHEAPDRSTATLTANEFEVSLDQHGAEALDIEGSTGEAELRRVLATGAVFIRTTQYDVSCDRFDYNPTTGIAEVSAVPGRTASFLVNGKPNPLRAEHAVWNMNTGAISIAGASGGG